MASHPVAAPDMSGVDPGLQPTLIALLYLFPGLALAILLVRFWRKSKDNLLGGDDALIALGWALSLGNTIITHMFTKVMYTGYRTEDIPYQSIDMKHAFKLQYALSVEYNPCICIIKASFLWTLYKLHSYNPWIKHSIVGLQILNLVYMISTTVISAVPCLPVARSWDKSIPGGCYDPTMYVTGNVSVVIITDFLVLFIPTWIIYDLHMPLKRKIVTISFLSLGFVVIAIGIARLLWLIDAFQGRVGSYSVKSAYTAIESSVAIIGTSGPTVKYLLGGCIPWLRPSFDRATSNKPSSYEHGNNSAPAGTPRNRSQNNTSDIYGDWDSASVKQADIELKSEWRFDSDAHSEEHCIEPERPRIIKSVEWTLNSAENLHAISTDSSTAGRPAALPAHMV